MELSLTEYHLRKNKIGTKLRIGLAARQFATEVDEAIAPADAATGNDVGAD